MAKQNKFTKSVQERLEQEAKRKPVKTAVSLPILDLPPMPAPLEEELPQETIGTIAYVPEDMPTTPPLAEEPVGTTSSAITEHPIQEGSDEPKAPATQESELNPPKSPPQSQETPYKRADLSAYLQKKEQRQAKNKTFYLDKEVCDAIRREAKTAKATESGLVNDILRGVLGLGPN